MNTRFAVAFLLFLLPAQAQLLAQASEKSAPAKAGSHFGFLSGIWRGEAWVRMGDQRYSFQQIERVAPYLDGSILLLDGRGSEPSKPDRTLFTAFAVISADPETGGYVMRSYSGGRVGTFPAELVAPNTMRWQHEGPEGMTRYTHRIEGDRWIGTGEVSKDGKTWTQTLGMDLKREENAPAEPWATR